MRSLLRKLRTFSAYAALGFSVGADFRSKLSISVALFLVRRGDCATRELQIKFCGRRMAIRLRPADIFIFYEMWSSKTYEVPALREFRPASILDLGAHVGLAALQFARLFPDAMIDCVEPSEENFTLLTFNTRDFPNLRCFNEAVGAQSGSCPFYFNANRTASGTLHAEGAPAGSISKNCVVKTLDQVIERVRLPVQMIKFDVEGREEALFSSSILVQQVELLVGELRGSSADILRFARLFPGHQATSTSITTEMHVVTLRRVSTATESLEGQTAAQR